MDETAATHPVHVSAATDGGAVIQLTDAAVEKVKAALQREGQPDQALRVSVVGGGCSGFQYSLGFDSAPRADDTVIEQDGVRLFVDSMSAQYLHGTTIDYVTGLHGAGFKFLNPNASRTCGCGSSFSA
ncbi:MAG TPA: iron-sulfur cluster insertion protein ErpA [Candidatus Acidoferrales bacterium]|nr:iron-sulfur cluster insertion protein ErpA [Candidatus Acidoferrales bacterium]